MAISEQEIKEFARAWYKAAKGAEAEFRQEEFFKNKYPKIYFTNTGVALGLKEHDQMATSFNHLKHTLGDIFITHLPCESDRVRVISTMYWSGCKSNDDRQTIQAVVGQDWILEKVNGNIKFVLYMLTSRQLLPGSEKFSV